MKLLRRSFLFLLALISAKFLTEYFSVGENRSQFWEIVKKITDKLTSSQAERPSQVKPVNWPKSPEIPAQVDNSKKEKTTVEIKSQSAKPIKVVKKTLKGISFFQTTIDLSDPETFITMGLANGVSQANSATSLNGDEDFVKLVKRYPSAVVANGTFFSKDSQKRVMGNMVAEGKFLKYSRWENYGTTLGIKADHQLEMVTARLEGQPTWHEHWFSLTCGPRLLKQGKIAINPASEGFKDPHVLDVGGRTAIGFPQGQKKLFLITFLTIVSLEKEAELMKSIGCYEAMNLDGGASKCLAHRGKILINGGRPLTNVIVVFDSQHKAPASLKKSWQDFQNGDRPIRPT